jgi:hypothetical protein
MRHALVVVMVLSASSAFAQVTATISGTVTDPSSATVAGAAMTAKEVDTGINLPMSSRLFRNGSTRIDLSI